MTGNWVLNGSRQCYYVCLYTLFLSQYVLLKLWPARLLEVTFPNVAIHISSIYCHVYSNDFELVKISSHVHFFPCHKGYLRFWMIFTVLLSAFIPFFDGFLAPFLKKLCFIFCTCERKNSIPIYVTRTRIENSPHGSHHILYLFESRWQARVVVRQIAFHQAMWSAPVFAAFTYHQLYTYRLPFSTFAEKLGSEWNRRQFG